MKRAVLVVLISTSHVFASQESSLNSIRGDRLKSPIEKDSELLPGDRTFVPVQDSTIDELVKRANDAFEQEKARQEKLRQEKIRLQEEKEKALAKKLSKLKVPVVKAQIIKRRKPAKKTIRYKKLSAKGPTVTVFRNNLGNAQQEYEKTVVLPAGSTALAQVMYGEDVSPQEKNRSVLLDVKTRFIGPNGSFVELNGCRAFATLEPQFSSEKIRASIQDLTCRCPNSGAVFTVESPGQIISYDTNYAGIESNLILGSVAKKALMDFSQSMLKSMGKAFQIINSTTSVNQNEHSSEKTTNVSGSKNDYLKGKIYEAQGDFLKTMNSLYGQASPRLAIAPGQKTIIVLRKNIEIPYLFFKELKEVKGEN